MIPFNKFASRILFIIFQWFQIQNLQNNKYKPRSIVLLRSPTTIKNSSYNSKQSVRFIKHYPMKTYGGNASIVPHIFKTEIKGGEWSLSSPDVSPPGQESLVTTGYKAGKTPRPFYMLWPRKITLPALRVAPWCNHGSVSWNVKLHCWLSQLDQHNWSQYYPFKYHELLTQGCTITSKETRIVKNNPAHISNKTPLI